MLRIQLIRENRERIADGHPWTPEAELRAVGTPKSSTTPTTAQSDRRPLRGEDHVASEPTTLSPRSLTRPARPSTIPRSGRRYPKPPVMFRPSRSGKSVQREFVQLFGRCRSRIRELAREARCGRCVIPNGFRPSALAIDGSKSTNHDLKSADAISSSVWFICAVQLDLVVERAEDLGDGALFVDAGREMLESAGREADVVSHAV